MDLFAAFDAARANADLSLLPAVGDHFVAHESRKYRAADGTPEVHRYSQRYVVTSVEGDLLDARVVALVAESGRPAWATSDLSVGSLSSLAVSHLRGLAEGRIEVSA